MAMSAAADQSAAVEQRNLSESQALRSRAVPSQSRTETQSRSSSSAAPTWHGGRAPIFSTVRRTLAATTDRLIIFEGQGARQSGDIRTFLAFSTGDESGLGADLPAGRVRVYTADVDGADLLIGESDIDHTAKGEEVMLALGAAFDLTGERIRTDFSFRLTTASRANLSRSDCATAKMTRQLPSLCRSGCTAGATGRSSKARRPS